jgi:hypothetical protein
MRGTYRGYTKGIARRDTHITYSKVEHPARQTSIGQSSCAIVSTLAGPSL